MPWDEQIPSQICFVLTHALAPTPPPRTRAPHTPHTTPHPRHPRRRRGHVCRLMMRGDFVPLFEALLLLVLSAPKKERDPILAEVLLFFRSDACLIWQLAHQCATVANALRCAGSGATGEAKRAHAERILYHQYQNSARRLREFVRRAEWADVRPVRQHMLSLLDEVRCHCFLATCTHARAQGQQEPAAVPIECAVQQPS